MTGIEENQHSLLMPDQGDYNGQSSTIPIDPGETTEALDSKGK